MHLCSDEGFRCTDDNVDEGLVELAVFAVPRSASHIY